MIFQRSSHSLPPEALAKANHLCFVIHTHFRLRNLKQRG